MQFNKAEKPNISFLERAVEALFPNTVKAHRDLSMGVEEPEYAIMAYIQGLEKDAARPVKYLYRKCK